jgi:hypothetical protein
MTINERDNLSLNRSFGRLVHDRRNSSATTRNLRVQNTTDLLSHRTNYCKQFGVRVF